MAKRKIEDVILEIASPIAEKNNFELVDVEFIKEGSNWYLRVYIDKPGGIMIDDCQVVSQALSERLDEIDPIEQSYFLEVSSPGLERPLKKDKDFEKFKGEQVTVKLFIPLNGKKVFEGELIGLVNNKIVINNSIEGNMEFEKDTVSKVRRVIKF